MSDAATIQREMFAAIEARDLDRLRELFHPDYAYTGTDGVEHAGAEAGLAVAERFTTAFPDLSIEVRASHAVGGDVAVVEIVARGTNTGPLDDIPPTGRRLEGVGCNVIEVRDGKIHRERDYFDTLALLQQLGVAQALAAS
jgi:steroid delta-isomerase-like uncharacterized protein